MKFTLFLFILICLVIQTNTYGYSIYVMDTGHQGATNVKAILTSLGHDVTAGGTTTLTDYSTYDQVWDLRYSVALTSTDIEAMSNFLKAGGNLYLTGENDGWDNRNASVKNLVSSMGGGTLNYGTINTVHAYQQLTSTGLDELGSPNTITQIYFRNARRMSAGNGFLITESEQSGYGSLIGWESTDITGNGNLLVGLDINMYDSTSATKHNNTYLIQNLTEFLGEASPIPEPNSIICMLFGTVLLGFKYLKKI